MKTIGTIAREDMALLTKQELVGKVRTIKFYDTITGATIAILSDGSTVKGDCDGEALEIGAGYRFFGRWRENAKWGNQFFWDTYTKDTPHDKRGIVRYLCEVCNGIGQATASKIFDAYGAESIRLLREDPGRLVDDGNLRADVAFQASRDLDSNLKFERTRVDLFSLFSGRGFGKAAITRCVSKWGVKATELIKLNPWLLLLHDIPRAGFKTVDRLYLELGGNPARLKRQMLAGWDGLRQGIEGNTWHPLGAFRSAVLSVLGSKQARLEEALALGLRSKWLASRIGESGSQYVAERQNAINESDLAKHILGLQAHAEILWPEVAPPEVSEHQAEQWNAATHGAVILLTGTPGTGKTFLAAAVLRALSERIGTSKIAVCAPTGKAAVRITEAMQRNNAPLEATTIHRLLKIGRNGHDGKGWGFLHNEENPLPYQVIAVDESSMLDCDLAASLFRACARGTHVLLIGDPYQLPPVGHGAPLRDLIAAGLPNAQLSEIKRNAGTIVNACKQIKEGRKFDTDFSLDEAGGKNLCLIECPDENAQLAMIEKVIRGIVANGKRDPIWDVQTLCPLNEKSRVSRVPLNYILQGILNPPGPNRAAESLGEFALRDKIICLRNCLLLAHELAPGSIRSDHAGYRPAKNDTWQTYQTFLANGDMGEVVAIDPAARTMICRFSMPERIVKIPVGKAAQLDGADPGGNAGDFTLAYCATVHKSQGSEWEVCLVVIDEAAGPVACRELIYTAISRAKKACLMFGKRSVADRQCAKVSLTKRKTFLKELLTNG